MESETNLHQLQDQPPAVEASSISTPSWYGVGNSHSCTSNITLDAGNFNPNLQEANPRSRALTQKFDLRISPRPPNGSMIQDLGSMPISPCNMEGYRPPPTTTTIRMKNEYIDMSERLLLKTLFGGDFYSTNAENYPSFGGAGVLSRGNFSQIYPSINISDLNQPSPSPAISSTLDTSMQSLDLLTSTRSYSGGDLSQRSQDHCIGRFTENLFLGLDRMQHPTHDTFSYNNSSNPSIFTNGMAETKRLSTLIEPSKASQSQTAAKKSRLESRSSCPPFKVRKEKLGDRIAALQQLVAPFGKTDTASVLMEAIGYIKFLQSQVETLSVPYMRLSRTQTNRMMQGGSTISSTNVEPKQDLRSRGLCLVPLSCVTYIAGGGDSELWQQPNVGGAL